MSSDESRTTMKACRVHRFGGPEVITLEDVPVPEPGAGEVRVRVAAAGVGPWDGWIRSGRSVLPQPLPLTLGSDLAGTVEAVGPGVACWQAGDAVFGVTNPRFVGAYAGRALAKADMIARRPARLDPIDAGGLAVVAVTAWQALFRHAKIVAGQSVLIHGAAGNVGVYAVQLAHRAGLRVIATAGAGDRARVGDLGADDVVDYRAERFEDRAAGIDAVIDLVGGDTQARSLSVLRPGGVLVSAVSEPDQAKAARHGVRACFMLVEVRTQDLERIAGMVEDGALTVPAGTVLPLSSARVAHEMLEGIRPRPKGKIVLRVGSD
jgi:NADPH:quinone reductase-like Zn-dependent oxidoreductase